MTDHPCKGLTKTQREAFERIAINQFPRCPQSTLDALLKRGVIECTNEARRDALGSYLVQNYYVPLPVHAQWCEWASEQPEFTQD
jgi:hypothetical protein